MIIFNPKMPLVISPPDRTLALISKTGVGKSTLANRLAGIDLATDPVEPCTKKPALKVMETDEFPNLAYRTAWLVDLPGFGEGVQADNEYRVYYRTWLPAAHDVLWLVQADSRAHKQDEVFLHELVPILQSGVRLRVILTRVDCLAIESDTPHEGRPTQEQLKHLDEKIHDVWSIFSSAIDGRISFEKRDIVPCSVKTGWGWCGVKKLLFKEKVQA